MSIVSEQALKALHRAALAAAAACLAGCATAPPQGPAAVARRPLAVARLKAPVDAVPLYLGLAQKNLAIATDKSASAETRVQATIVYNTAMARCAVALQKQHLMPSAGSVAVFHGPDSTYSLQVVKSGGPAIESPARFDKFIEAATVSRKHLKADVQRAGLGGPLVGVTFPKTDTKTCPPCGFAEPVTDIATFGKVTHAGVTPVGLSFLDPREETKVTVDGSTFPLRADFTAPLAYFPHPNQLVFGLIGMFRSDRIAQRSAVYFLGQYDPNKIPVLFVHGLMSSPHAWVDFVNDLEADPDFRKRYQPWVFFYPSGAPIGANAVRLREALADIAARYPLKHKIVVVGHSMGGILTQMQITSTGRTLWNTLFKSHGEAVYNQLPADSVLKKVLIFNANPNISRVVFISTPHLGSNLASLRISMIAGSLIRMPVDLVQALNPQTIAAIRLINPAVTSLPSSIVGLSPNSPMLVGVSKLKITVPYHSIIGNQGHDNVPLAKSSDGVVPYWSSHLDGAQSEIIVPTGHDAFDCPQSVKEVLRILALQKD